MTRPGSEHSGGVSDDLREVLLTLSATEFERFARDLKLLREHCAKSNTQAIVDAVREHAMSVRVRTVDDRRAA